MLGTGEAAPPGVLAVSAGEGGGDPSEGGLRSLSKYQTDRGVQIDGEACGWVQVTEKATHDAFGEIVLEIQMNNKHLKKRLPLPLKKKKQTSKQNPFLKREYSMLVRVE